MQQLPSIDHLAAKVGLSARALTRRWFIATGLNFRPYVAALRLELSETLLRTTDLPLKHIATECGFSSSSALSRAFAQRFGKGSHSYRMDARLEKAGTRAGSPDHCNSHAPFAQVDI